MNENLNENMRHYFSLLIEQYLLASGTKNYNVTSKVFMSDFSEWIKNRQEMGNNYQRLLFHMDLDKFTHESTAEVGKGELDTIVKPYDTKIITPYTTGLETLGKGRVIDADLLLYSETPILMGVSKGQPIITYPNNIATFMIQNPYCFLDMHKCEQLHNSGKYDIIFGVYGDIHDKDIQTKRRLVQDLKDRLLFSVKEEECILDDTYCYVVATDDYVLTKTKRLYR